jgi:hypothetical protein
LMRRFAQIDAERLRVGAELRVYVLGRIFEVETAELESLCELERMPSNDRLRSQNSLARRDSRLVTFQMLWGQNSRAVDIHATFTFAACLHGVSVRLPVSLRLISVVRSKFMPRDNRGVESTPRYKILLMPVQWTQVTKEKSICI